MALALNTYNNEDTEEDTKTVDESTPATAIDDEDNNEQDDELTTLCQPPMQLFGMNVNLTIPTLQRLNSLMPS
eukprot:4757029-Ditylum_brightwellii.AAC.1